MSHIQIVQAVLKVWFQENIGLLLNDFEIYWAKMNGGITINLWHTLW